jgi:hypothetical protein
MDGCPGGPAAQKTISCPGDQAQGHREGKSSKPLPFECNLNVSGGRAKFAAAARPGRGVTRTVTITDMIQLFTTSDALA